MPGVTLAESRRIFLSELLTQHYSRYVSFCFEASGNFYIEMKSLFLCALNL